MPIDTTTDARWLEDLLLHEPDDDALRALVEELQPYDLAQFLPELQEAGTLRLLRLLPRDVAAETLEYVDPDLQYRLLDHLPPEVARGIVAQMPGDAIADLMGALHPRQAELLLQWVPADQREGIRTLAAHPENTAGGRMTPDYVSVRQDRTVEQALAHVRKVGREAETIQYLYVVDAAGKLVGVASLREVLFAQPGRRVADIMFEKVVSVQADADQEVAAALLADYDFGALPVVDAQGRMIGIITADDVLDVVQEEATEDIHKLGATQPLDEPFLQVSLLSLYKKRIGWLLFLFVAQSLTSNILRHYQGFLDEVVALAFFIPLLIGTGGNAGSQTSTLVIRAMALGEVEGRDVLRLIWRESKLAMSLGLSMAVVAFLRAAIMGGPVDLGLTVAAAVAGAVLVGATFGAALPIVGRRLGFDPAVFSSPLITTAVDAAGLIIYFQMARLILGLGR